MNVDEAKRFPQLETENARLKQVLAEAELDKAMLRGWPRETSNPERRDGPAWPDRTCRGLRAPCLQGDRPVALHSAPGLSGHP